jgi:hypothetical protein
MLELQQEKYEVLQEQVEGALCPDPRGQGVWKAFWRGKSPHKDKKLDNMS